MLVSISKRDGRRNFWQPQNTLKYYFDEFKVFYLKIAWTYYVILISSEIMGLFIKFSTYYAIFRMLC